MHAVVARGDDDTGRHRRPTNDLILYKKVGVLTGGGTRYYRICRSEYLEKLKNSRAVYLLAVSWRIPPIDQIK